MKKTQWKDKLVALGLVLVLLFTFTACSGSGEPSSSSDSSSSYPYQNQLEDPNSSSSQSQAEVETPELLDLIIDAAKVNSDTVGWLQVPNTTVDDAVVKREGDTTNEYYLRLDKTGKWDWYGCYYTDYRANIGTRDQLSRNTVIYGHSMDDDPEGLKFSQLKHYLDLDFAANNPYIYFSTAEEDMVWQVFAVFYSDINFNYNNPNPDDAAYADLLSQAKARSELIYEDIDVTTQDKILTLSTCTYKFGSRLDQRFVVMAKLVDADEPLVETVTVTQNPSPVAPQF